MEELKRISMILEDVVRGRPYDEFKVLGQCKAYYIWASTDPADGLMSTETRSEIFKAGIQLHNKLRVLPPSLSEAKAYLKGASAWLLLRFGDLRPVSIHPYVKVFIRASAELANFAPDGNVPALNCINQALASWTEIGSSVFERSLNPVEFAELKLSIVNSYIEVMNLLLKTPQEADPVTELRSAAASAAELLSLVPFTTKLAFVKAAANIGHRLARNSRYDDAAYFFSVAVANIDCVQKVEILEYAKGDGRKLAAIVLTKIRLNLCLSFVLQEQNLCERAMECVKIAESLSLDSSISQNCTAGGDEEISLDAEYLKGCFEYAKFTVNCKAGDWEVAGRNIYHMIENVTDLNINTVFDAISAFTEATERKDTLEYLQFYKCLLDKFSDGPIFSLVRVKLLDAMPIFDSEIKLQNVFGADTRPEDYCLNIICEHLSEKHILPREAHELLRQILNQRTTFFQINNMPREVLTWCNLSLKLHCAPDVSVQRNCANFIPVGDGWYWGESSSNNWLNDTVDFQNDYSTALLRKVDALLQLGLIQEAFDVGIVAVNMTRSTRSIAIAFSAALVKHSLTNNVDAGISFLIELISPFETPEKSIISGVIPSLHTTQNMSFFVKSLAGCFTADFKIMTLERLLICAQLAESTLTSDSNRSFLLQLLIRIKQIWIDVFQCWEVWRNQSSVNHRSEYLDDDFGQGIEDCSEATYAGILCEIFDHFKSLYTKKTDSLDFINPFHSRKRTNLEVNSPMYVKKKHIDEEVAKVDDEEDEATQRCDVELQQESLVPCKPTSSKGETSKGSLDDVDTDEMTLTCTIQVIKRDINENFSQLYQLISNLVHEEISTFVLGTMEDLKYIADYGWNIAVCLLRSNSAIDQGPDSHVQQLRIASELLEICAFIDNHIENERGQPKSFSSSVFQGTCLLVASAARLDINRSNEKVLSSSNVSVVENKGSSCDTNLDCSLFDVQKAITILEAVGEYQDETTRKLLKRAFIIEFRNLCFRPRSSSSDQVTSQKDDRSTIPKLESYYENNTYRFLQLSIAELQDCARIAKTAVGGSFEVSRSILYLAIQNGLRDPFPDYNSIGHIYFDLIKISASRKQAFEKIEEFEQLLASLQTVGTGDEQRSVFAAEDIDGICSITYNYGVSLLELEMIDLAEKFICKALALFQHASPSMLGWKTNIQSVYTHILRAKLDMRKSSMLNDSGLIADISQSTEILLFSTSVSVPRRKIGEDDNTLSTNMFG